MPNASATNQTIQEYVDSRGESLLVERHSGVLRGVKLLGVSSRNGRRYPDDALRRAMPLYEGAKVNINHPKGDPLSPRDYQDRIGVIRDVEFRAGAGLYGVLQFNPHHTLAEQLVWDAENAPENVGLSHNVLAKTAREGDGVVVEEITRVQSVDLVADPATTRGLFEHGTLAPFAADESLAELTFEALKHERPDLIEAATERLREELSVCRAELDQCRLREAADERRRRVERSLVEHGLPVPVAGDPAAERLISEDFLRMLLEAGSDAEVDRLVRDRADALAEAKRWRPSPSPATCREQTLAGGEPTAPAAVLDAAAFVTAITTR